MQGRPMKLDHMPTEELRKWAKAYNENSEAERDILLNKLQPFADGILDKDRPTNNLPLEMPTFTLKMIRDAVPSHCFKRNLFTSLSHLASDLMIIACLGYAATWINNPALPAWSSYVLWPLYWYWQGAVMTGVWVLAHECGHQSFSESELANNIVGTICHSLLLVPYHSWRITHSKHHANTGKLLTPVTHTIYHPYYHPYNTHTVLNHPRLIIYCAFTLHTQQVHARMTKCSHLTRGVTGEKRC